VNPANVEQLAARLREALQPRPEILDAYLFGSRARGDTSCESDIDVAIFVDRAVERVSVPPSPFGYESALTAELMSAVADDRVDVVILNDASPLLYHRVLRDGIRLLARRPEATTSREGLALSRYCDYLPQLRKIDSAHAARIARGTFGR
jgi:predicted nucleotidyltransferase